MTSGGSTCRMNWFLPSRLSPAAARMMASYSPSASLRSCVSTLPRKGCISKSFRSALSCAWRRRLRVGTSSLRRQAQLKALRNDLEIHPLRGNVDTQLRKLADGEYDAIILAAAGLSRLGKNQFMRHVLPPEVMCPAAGQGALAIEIRAGDFATAELVKFLDDRAARLTTNCERALLSKLGGGCQVPIGALAELRGDRLHLEAIVASPDGGKLLRESRE